MRERTEKKRKLLLHMWKVRTHDERLSAETETAEDLITTEQNEADQHYSEKRSV